MNENQPEKPNPPPKPQVDPQFLQLSTIHRIIETFRYSILSLEYSISPNGQLRSILFVCLFYWLILSIPILLFLPLLHFAFTQVSSIVLLLSESVSHLILPLSLITFILLLLNWTFKR